MPIIWVNSTVYLLETFTPKGRRMVCVVQYLPIHYFIVAFIIYVSRTWVHIHIGTTYMQLLKNRVNLEIEKEH